MQPGARRRTNLVNENLTIRIDGQASVHYSDRRADRRRLGAEARLAASLLSAILPSHRHGRWRSHNDNTMLTRQTLEHELRATKAQLQAAIDELEIVNEEMKSTTEEYQSVNEELQSSNEELETSKEEMQSVNEELQTSIARCNSKNEQLTRLNTDMQNLLDSTQIATVFLDDRPAHQELHPGAARTSSRCATLTAAARSPRSSPAGVHRTPGRRESVQRTLPSSSATLLSRAASRCSSCVSGRTARRRTLSRASSSPSLTSQSANGPRSASSF